MSKIEDKILGKDKKEIPEMMKNDVFAASVVWQVKKDGCGKSMINGQMAYEMMSPEGKEKARKGTKKITDKDFVFERQS